MCELSRRVQAAAVLRGYRIDMSRVVEWTALLEFITHEARWSGRDRFLRNDISIPAEALVVHMMAAARDTGRMRLYFSDLKRAALTMRYISPEPEPAGIAEAEAAD